LIGPDFVYFICPSFCVTLRDFELGRNVSCEESTVDLAQG